MKRLIPIVMVCSSVFGGALAGRLWAAKKCAICYTTADAILTGRFDKNRCYAGYCKGSSSLSECYKETCIGCTGRDGIKCDSGIGFTCPAEGNCVNGKPQSPHLCINSCHC